MVSSNIWQQIPPEFFLPNEARRVRYFKTKDSRHSKIKYTYIIYIITSFINSETTALLHLTSFTEDVTNISFHIPVWEIFCEFLRFCNFFHKPLGECEKQQNMRNEENICQYCTRQRAITTLSLNAYLNKVYQ